MSLSHVEYFKHILDETEYILSQTGKLTKDEFMADPTLKRAFVRSIEIIGEDVKKIPEEVRLKNTKIEWKAIAGMRDKLIHFYFGIDYDIVWDVVVTKIPELHSQIEVLLASESGSK